jgi:hypothetical protein
MLVGTGARASVVVSESLKEMTHGAQRIVRGFVVNTQATRDAHTGNISTYVDLEVAENLKGSAGKTLRIRVSGGEVGNVSQEVAGAPRFEVGQDVLLFLEASRDSELYLVRSLAAGKVDFERQPNGQTKAKRRLDGLTFVLQRPQGIIEQRPSENLGSAEELLVQIRSWVAAR